MQKNQMRFRFTLQSIPVSIAALGLWALIGGWYIAIAPADLAGADNIGIVLSTFGICLFLADRLAFGWLHLNCWMIFFKLWVWGMVFMAWGFAEWIRVLSKKFALVFIIHWLTIALVVAAVSILVNRRHQQNEEKQNSSFISMK